MQEDETTRTVNKKCVDPSRFCTYEYDRSGLMREMRLTRVAMSELSTAVTKLVAATPDKVGERLAAAETQIKITKWLCGTALATAISTTSAFIASFLLGKAP